MAEYRIAKTPGGGYAVLKKEKGILLNTWVPLNYFEFESEALTEKEALKFAEALKAETRNFESDEIEVIFKAEGEMNYKRKEVIAYKKKEPGSEWIEVIGEGVMLGDLIE